MTSADLDRLETMCACLFSLLSEDNERTTVLPQVKKIQQKIVVRRQNGYLIGGIYGLVFSHLLVRSTRGDRITLGDR